MKALYILGTRGGVKDPSMLLRQLELCGARSRVHPACSTSGGRLKKPTPGIWMVEANEAIAGLLLRLPDVTGVWRESEYPRGAGIFG